ncbi:MAG: glucosyltransferase domain-containing protein [Bacteroidota bacterium]
MRSRYFLILLFILSVLLYWRLFDTYAFSDTYEFLLSAKRNSGDFLSNFVRMGRPLYGLLNYWFYPGIESIDSLKWMRLFGYVGSMLFCLMSYTVILEANIGKNNAQYLIVFLLTSAPMTIIIGWCATFQVGWALLFATLSSWVLMNDKILVRHYILSILLGLICLNLYQPAFGIFLFFGLLIFWKDKNLSGFLKVFLVYLSCLLFYFILYKVLLDILELEEWRSGISLDILSKLKWFFGTVLFKIIGFNLKFLGNGTVNILRFSALLLLLVALIKWIRSHHDVKSYYWGLALIISLFGTYLPNLLSVESFYTNRTGLATSALLALLLFTSNSYIFGHHHGKILNMVFTGLFILFGFTNFINFVNINALEYSAIQTEIKKIQSDIKYSTIPLERGFLKKANVIKDNSGGEFGELSSSFEWSAEPIIWHVSKDMGQSINLCKLNCSEAKVIDIESAIRQQFQQNTRYFGWLILKK